MSRLVAHVTFTATDHLHVVGAPASGPGTASTWNYAVTVACQNCSVNTVLGATLPIPATIVTITIRDDVQSLMRTTRYELMGAGGMVANQNQHKCTIQQYGRPPVNDMQTVFAALTRLEQTLHDRASRDAELERLAGLVRVLTDSTRWNEEALEGAKRQIATLIRQIRAVHDYLDCPCEMELDTLDLVTHLKEMGVP
jgi:hypothetical protein